MGEIMFVLDPPRKGVDIEILQELLKLAPDKIIYISCNPATLARDVGILVGTLTINDNGLSKTAQDRLDSTHINEKLNNQSSLNTNTNNTL